MRIVNETQQAEDKIKSLELWDRYQKQKAFFIANPSHHSLDFCLWDKKTRICSFKITNQYRVKVIKNPEGSYTVFDAGDFHKPK